MRRCGRTITSRLTFTKDATGLTVTAASVSVVGKKVRL
jgi:hypothetical protein